jgi:hypothetical protein
MLLDFIDFDSGDLLKVQYSETPTSVPCVGSAVFLPSDDGSGYNDMYFVEKLEHSYISTGEYSNRVELQGVELQVSKV